MSLNLILALATIVVCSLLGGYSVGVSVGAKRAQVVEYQRLAKTDSVVFTYPMNIPAGDLIALRASILGKYPNALILPETIKVVHP